MEDEKIVKYLDTDNINEIFDIAKGLIEDHHYVFEIYNRDDLWLGVNAFDDYSYGITTKGDDDCSWAEFCDANPTLWDEFDKLYSEHSEDEDDE